MSSKSKNQQKFMGMVHSLQKGDMKPSDASQDVKDAAKSMSKKDAKDYASTSHKNLPKKVKQEIVRKLKEYASKMGTNTMGGDTIPTKKKGGLRDFDGYDNVDYNKDMPMDEGCWKGYKQIGGKMKNGKPVPNCVPESVDEGGIPQNWMQGRTSDYHTKLRGKKREYEDGTNFDKENSGQDDVNEYNLEDIIYQVKRKNPKDKKLLTIMVINRLKEKRNNSKSKSNKQKIQKVLDKIEGDYNKGKYIKESFDNTEHLKLLNLALRAMPNSPKQKEIIKKLNKVRVAGGMKPLKETRIVEYGQRLDLSYLEDEEARLDGTPEPKDAIDTELDETAKRDYKAEYKKFQSSTKSKKYRAELNKYNRQKGTYGNGDCKDASHKGGKIVGFESESKNRGRKEKSRLKKK